MKTTLALLAMLGCGVSAQAGSTNMPFVGVNLNNENDRFQARDFLERVQGEDFVDPVAFDDDYEGGFNYSDDDDNQQAGPSGSNDEGGWNEVLAALRQGDTGPLSDLLVDFCCCDEREEETLAQMIPVLGDFLNYYNAAEEPGVVHLVHNEFHEFWSDIYGMLERLVENNHEGAVHDALVVFFQKTLLNDSIIKAIQGKGASVGIDAREYFYLLETWLEEDVPSGKALLKAFRARGYLDRKLTGRYPTFYDYLFRAVVNFNLIDEYLSDDD